MKEQSKTLLVVGMLSADRVELRGIPSSFLPFVRVRDFSPTAIPLHEWPATVYAGILHVSGHRLAFYGDAYTPSCYQVNA